MTASAQQSPTTASAAGEPSDEDRFGAIHARHCAGIWRYLRRLGLTAAEADDALQQTFLVLAQRLGEIRLEAERAFTYGVASRVASDIRRRAARRCEVDAPSGNEEAIAVRPDELLEERDRVTLLDAILVAMAPDLREVFVLFEIEELTMREIAVIVKVPPGTVASRIRRARAEFKRATAQYKKGPAR